MMKFISDNLSKKMFNFFPRSSLRAISVIFFFLLVYFVWAPSIPSAVIIEKGMTLDDATELLEKSGVVNSSFILKVLVKIMGDDDKIMSGRYSFSHNSTIFSVASRITKGKFGIPAISVFIPEGSSVVQIAKIISAKIDGFDEKEFIKLGLPKEGYLFPDTYNFLPTIVPEEVIVVMEKNFELKTDGLMDEIKKSGKSLKDIIIMASIIEEEANTEESRRIVSGILWKRISIGMPLQVDAPFDYERGLNTFELTMEDLAIKSPYNTYKFTGLPKGPITNPGLDSIIASIRPTKTNYLFYISDKKGGMHYATNLAGHNANINKYLR